jgi:hypothetical protein
LSRLDAWAFACAAKSAGGATAQASESTLPSPHQHHRTPVQQPVSNLIDLDEEEDQGEGTGDGQPVDYSHQPQPNNLGLSPASSSGSHQHREPPNDPFMELVSRGAGAHPSLGKHASTGDVPSSLLGKGGGISSSEAGQRSNSFGAGSTSGQEAAAASTSGRDATGGAIAAAPAGAPPWHSWFTGRRASKHHHTPSAPPQPASSEAVAADDAGAGVCWRVLSVCGWSDCAEQLPQCHIPV